MKKLILSIIFLLIAANAFADALIDATGCTVEEINTALSTASGSTGVVTVTIPTCSSTTHTSAISINMSSGYANVTSLILRGASKAGTILNNSAWAITVPSAKKFRMTNMTLTGTRSGSGTGMINIAGGTKPSAGGGFRLDNLIMNGSGSRAVYITGDSYGLIDSITSEWNGQWALNRGQTQSGLGGNTTWAANDSFGTAEAVYIENCTLTNTYASYIYFVIDNDAGARTVIRHNVLNNYHFGGHDAIIGSLRSNRHWEAYNNFFTTNFNYGMTTFNMRGGTGYIYNNRTHSTVSNNPYSAGSQIYLRNKRDESLAGVGTPWNAACDTTAEKFCAAGTFPKSCTTDADCAGVSGACRQMDGNEDDTGWPCIDQIGRGKDQALKPALFWNNKTIFPNLSETYTVPVSATTHIQNNRDYCYHNTTMPATCNEVETVYTAYTCPHPLTGVEGGSCDPEVAGTTGYTLTGGDDDETAPICTWAIDTTGLIATGSCSESVDAVTKTGLSFTGSVTGAITATYKDGMPGANPRFDLGAEVQQSDVVTADYATPGTGIKDLAGNSLANFTGASVFNASTKLTPPGYELTVTKTGSGCTITSSPSGIIAGTTTTAYYDAGTVVTLGGYVAGGWNPVIVYGGHCASNGTVTMDAAKTCTATCKEKLVTNWYPQ